LFISFCIILDLDFFSEFSDQDVDHAEDVGADNDSGDGHVREQENDEVEHHVVDDCSSVGIVARL